MRHGHVQVNGGRVDIPSYRVTVGEEVRVAPDARELVPVKMALEGASRGAPMSWRDPVRVRRKMRTTPLT